jgi:hypothetical protein
MLVEEINNMFRVSVHDLEDFDGLVSTWVACPQTEHNVKNLWHLKFHNTNLCLNLQPSITEYD